MSLTFGLITIKIPIIVVTALLKIEPSLGKRTLPKKMRLHKNGKIKQQNGWR